MRGIQRRERLFLVAISGLLPALASSASWPADLDWAPLAARLSDGASLVDATFADWQSECLPEFRDNEWLERTNHGLIDQPSGTCVTQLFCAYERCYPRPDDDGHAGTTLSTRLNDTAGTYPGSWDELPAEVQGWLVDPANPALNLPSKVFFPAVASDVIAAVEFAIENGLELSVKNSGHSFTGASTKRDTLHVNMNRFQRYASTGSIVGCGGDEADADPAACALAEARGKPGYVRVGGGENFDKVYRAVDEFNEANGNTYHFMGGAAGTVSPLGWTFQGGLGGTTRGRSYGLGVDQILQVEMVLPNGLHVKFGPAEWEDASADGFVAPRTTSVEGKCRANPDETNEDAWEWGDCPEDRLDVTFDDLWYAVSGGGGGTWGVVTSIYLQLHAYVPPVTWGYFPGFGCDDLFAELGLTLVSLMEAFRATWVLMPSRLNVTQAESDDCGSPDGTPFFVCYGDGPDAPLQKMLDAWKSVLEASQDQFPDGVTVDDVYDCALTVDGPYHQIVLINDGPYAGKVQDAPQPSLSSTGSEARLNVLIPREFTQNEAGFDQFVQTFSSPLSPLYQPPYFAFGSGTKAASDQANSLSDAHRRAGVKVYIPQEPFYSQIFSLMYDLSDKSNFPGFLGHNHAGNNMMGPLKDDWTKPCPPEWTQQERDEKCVSLQEAIYGTKTLQRLEAIKEALDPNYIFDCTGCIGNNRVKDTPDAPSPASADDGGDEPTPAADPTPADDPASVPTPAGDPEADPTPADDPAPVPAPEVDSAAALAGMGIVTAAAAVLALAV